MKAWKWDRKTLHILAHEETHVKAHNSTLTGMKNNADYVGEHLCWYFQSVVSQEGNYTLHPEIDQSGNLISMLDYLKQHPNYTLADLAEPVPDPDGIGDMQTKYARGEILVSFYNFLETTYGTEDFKNFLWIMMNNENYGVVDALNNIYGKKLSDFDKDWRCFYGLPEKNVNLIRRLTTRIKQLIH